MTVSRIEQITVFESPDGGKTVYSRTTGDGPSSRQLVNSDPVTRLTNRWVNLKEAVLLDDPAINELLAQIEMMYALKT